MSLKLSSLMVSCSLFCGSAFAADIDKKMTALQQAQISALEGKLKALQAELATLRTKPAPFTIADSSGNVVRRMSVLSFVHPSDAYPPGRERISRYYHIRTPIKLQGSEMFRYDLKGYAYGIGKPLDFTWVGYYFAGYDNFNNNLALNRNDGDGIKASMYTAKRDKVLVLKFGPLDQYYNSFTLDFQSGSTGEHSDHSPAGYKVVLTDGDVELESL